MLRAHFSHTCESAAACSNACSLPCRRPVTRPLNRHSTCEWRGTDLQLPSRRPKMPSALESHQNCGVPCVQAGALASQADVSMTIMLICLCVGMCFLGADCLGSCKCVVALLRLERVSQHLHHGTIVCSDTCMCLLQPQVWGRESLLIGCLVRLFAMCSISALVAQPRHCQCL
jgi:hypothetical protein